MNRKVTFKYWKKELSIKEKYKGFKNKKNLKIKIKQVELEIKEEYGKKTIFQANYNIVFDGFIIIPLHKIWIFF